MFSPFSYAAKPQFNTVTVIDPALQQYGSYAVETSMTNDGQFAIARGQNTAIVQCFNGITGALRYTFANQSPGMNTRCAVSPDGRFAAISDSFVTVSGKANVGRVYLFNLPTGSFVRAIDGPNPENLTNLFFGFSGLSFSDDGSRLAVASYLYPYVISGFPSGYPGGAVHVFNTATGALISTCSPTKNSDNQGLGQSAAISADGSLVLIGAPEHRISSVAGVGRAFLYNATTGAVVWTFNSTNPKNNGYFGYRVSISRDKKLSIISEPSQTQSTATNAGRLYIFNNDTGALIATITNPDINKYRRLGYDSVLISNDRNRIYVNAWDTGLNFKTLLMFNANTQAFIKLVPPVKQAITDFGNSYADSLSLTLDDSRLCVNHAYFPDSDPLYPAVGGFYLMSQEIL